jgi:hypothetical protein
MKQTTEWKKTCALNQLCYSTVSIKLYINLVCRVMTQCLRSKEVYLVRIEMNFGCDVHPKCGSTVQLPPSNLVAVETESSQMPRENS